MTMTISELNNYAAYQNNTPITSPSQLPSTFSFEKGSEEPVFFWGGATLQDAISHYPDHSSHFEQIHTLGEHLLSFGGTRACMSPNEERVDAILSRGQIWLGEDAEFFKGMPSSCHDNCMAFYMHHYASAISGIYLATGYALSDDGLWRQHSWNLHVKEDGSTRIIESTVERLCYFGFVLTHEEILEF